MYKATFENVLQNALNIINQERKTKNLVSAQGIIPMVDTCADNVVSEDSLRKVQQKVLKDTSDYLEHTFGPMGSYTKIISGNDANSVVSRYSKDGHTVLKHILYSNTIEMSIRAELEEITRHVELEVGDGTTSAILLSNLIFNSLLDVIDVFHDDIPPYRILDHFKYIVSQIQEEIYRNKKEVEDIKDIHNICMISTNSNELVSDNITNIYKQFGFGVEIDVSISNTKNDTIKIYDGLTLSTGYSDPCYINNKEKGVCELYKPEIYAFKDPIDAPDMINIFSLIINNNIVEPMATGDDIIPTVIIAPKLSSDLDSMLGPVIDTLNVLSPKDKKLLIITDIIGSDEAIYLDIAKLCGCSYIKRYIDPKIKELDMEKGLVPNETNFRTFAGLAEQVVSNINKTKFINPCKLVDENGNRVETDEYKSLVTFLQAELDHAKENGEDDRSVSYKKKRLNSLKSNMVEYLVGGITIGDRDSLKDLVIDAVKNCRSACEKGYGYAANFEGLRASMKVFIDWFDTLNTDDKDSINISCLVAIAARIFYSYYEVTKKLYSTVEPDSAKVRDIIVTSIVKGCPYNISNGHLSFGEKDVLTSIDTDIKILEAISKLVSLMATSNQCLLQAPNLNTYKNM